LSLRDDNQKQRVRLRVGNDGPHLVLWDENGNPVLHLQKP
jgi:hypothetical protein